MTRRLGALILALGCLAGPLAALSVSSASIQVDGDSSQFIFGLGTAPSYSPSGASLTYASPGASYTSHLVFWVNGTPYALAGSTNVVISPMTAVGSGTGAYLECVLDIGGTGLRATLHYEIVDNPQNGSAANAMKIKVSLQNTNVAVVTYGVRLEFDTQINGNDGANISVDNGASVIANNTVYAQGGGGVPGNWWGYDVAPPGTPNLIGQGSLYGNPLGEAATQPDALEVAYWGNTSGATQWSQAPGGASISDSSVVLWWTGTGQTGTPVLSLAPGASSSLVTYYGINGVALLSTFTPTPVPGTRTDTPTVTVSPSITPTFSASPSFTVSPTFSLSPTFSETPTISASPTLSVTRTITLTLTPSPEPLLLKLLPANPDPAATEAWLPYFLSTGSRVDIQVWTMAGERVCGWEAGFRPAGYREERWDLHNEAHRPVSSGIYIYRIRARSPAGEEKADFRKCAVTR